MDKDSQNFKEYVHSGLDRFVSLAAQTGSAISNVTQDAIVKIDVVQLKKKKDSLLKELGLFCYLSFSKNKSVDSSVSEVSSLMKEIEFIQVEIEKREEKIKNHTEKNDEK